MKPKVIVYKKNNTTSNEKEFDLKKLYEDACNCNVSDIYIHLPVLYQYAQDCDHVTEMGARSGNSTKAFLYANPKKFISSKEIGVNCQYIGADVLTIEIEETDLLFIDTWHCYDQLKKELELHAGKVRKYIAFHDTYTFGQKGEGYPDMDVNHPHRDDLSGEGGIRKAIDEFLKENPEWEINYETEENNGLIVIAKY